MPKSVLTFEFKFGLKHVWQCARHRVRPLALIVLGLLWAASAQAEKADRDKPTNIVFSQAAIDDLKQTQVFTGDVIYTRGTIIIRADQLTVRQDLENYSTGSAVMTQPGKLAYYKQKREGLDEDVEGQASRIDYNEKTDIVTLTGNAVMRRLSGAKLMDEVHGNVIEYHSQTESYTVVGQATGVETNDASPRARVTMQPKTKSEPQTAPPAPLDLKSSPNLDGKPVQ